MKKIYFIFIVLILLNGLSAQTSWIGTTSTNWSTASNWSSGVPNSTTDAIIGDANFTGSFHPVLTVNSSCKSLTIGNSIIASTLTVAKNITVSGTLTIGANGTISHTAANTIITLSGNWINSGVYTTSVTTNKVTFAGTAQSITGITTFKQLIINAGSTTSLANNIVVNSTLTVSGTLDPSASFNISGSGSVTVNSSGILFVKAADFSSNYNLSGTYTLNGTSTVNYASSIINQNITNTLTYGYLRVSGGLTKTLTGNLPSLNSSSNSSGRIYVDAGTLDLLTFTANRGTTVTGGSIILATSSVLKIGGTNSLPTNYSTKTFATTSTVEYGGTNQTIVAATYGNLIFKSSSGSVVKTMPATAMTIAGSFTSAIGSGTAITFTAGNNITVNLNTNLDAGTTFNGNSFTHTFQGNWINDGAYNGGTSNVIFRGLNAALSGTGANNFFNLRFSKGGITAAGTTSINVSGNLSTTGPGAFTHASGGVVTMSGTSKTVAGNGFKLNDFLVTGTVTTNANISVSGDLTINGSLIAGNRIITLSGTSKSILGSGPLSFYSLSVLGTITTARDFSVSLSLAVALSASLNQTAGTSVFNGTGNTLAGTSSLFNVTINSGKTLKLGSNSELGIANVFTKTGTLNVTATIPNTVRYNATSAQSVVSTTYHNLILENNSTKTAAGAITINNDFTNNSTCTFNASSFVFSLYRHFTNNGTFTASTSTVQLLGANAADITGVTTFHNLTQNKNSAAIKVTLNNSITTNTLTMTAGNMATGSNSVTINSTRTGAGIIIGIISHSHAFTNGTTYFFEGPQNGITFNTPSSSLTAVTVTVTIGSISDFLGGDCVTREYNISIPAGTYTDAKLQLHYEDNELNAFIEPSLSQYHYNTGTSIWDSIGVTTRNATVNYIEKTPITSITGRWALSGDREVVRWNGSVSSAWENSLNWTTISGVSMANRVPTSTDAAEIGQATFTNNPIISSTQTISILKYGSVQQSTLTINAGASLTTVGAVKGAWVGSASHILNVGSGSLTVGTNMDLSDGTSGHDIQLKIGSGSAVITNNLVQKASGSVNFTGSGSLSIAGSYSYSAGSFTPNTGTVIYTGGNAQVVAPLTYYNLSFTKSTEEASINFPTTINGNLTMSTGGSLLLNDTITVAGNITIGASTNLIENSARINCGGNWSNGGIFTLANGTVNFNGSSNQTIDANTFNTLIVNKTSGSLTLSGDLSINSNLTITSGTVDISTFLANRSSPGGILTMSPSSYLKVGGATNFPSDFITNTIDATSTVEYLGAVAQNVANIDYGNLTFSNGGASAKLLLGDIIVNGNLLINSGATLNPDSIKITAFGNISNSGTFSPGGSTILLAGTAKSIIGNWTCNNLSIIGTYTSTGTSISMTGDLLISAGGSMNFNTTSAILDGDLTNSGSLTSNGVATFTGIRVQTLQLLNSISSSGGIINFNGTVSPILNSTSSPQFAILNINNTGGVAASVPWLVAVACNIGVGASFDGGALTHTFLGNFTNNGTVTSSGEMKFTPIPPYSSGATINLGTSSYTNTGKTRFGGAVPLTIVGTNLQLFNVDITNTNTIGITPPSNWVIQNDLFVASSATLNLGTALSHTIGGVLTNNGTINGNTSTTTFTGNPITINGIGSTNFNNINIATASDVSLNQDIKIARDFVYNGAFNSNGFELMLNGSINSTISGSSGTLTLDELNQNKSGTAITSLSIPIIINTKLQLTNGVINTTTTNILTLVDNAITSGGTTTSFVNGPMKKIGDDAFDFPVGNNNVWARIGMSAPTTVTSEFQAQYFAAIHSNTSSVTAPLDHVSTVEYWTLDRNIGTDNVAVTLFWESGSRSVITDLTDLVVARFNGTSWVDETQAGGVTGTTSLGTVTSQLVTSFNPFTFASRSGANPLPIELLDFKATCNTGGVLLNWITASETNNDYYKVDKSTNGVDWQLVGKINGSGNNTTLKNYTYQDNSNITEITYYRLTQVDYDGSQKIYNLISTDCTGNQYDHMLLYPNPSNNELHIDFNLTQNYGNGIVKIMDNIGRIIFEQDVQLSQGLNNNKLHINLPAGLYIVNVYSEQLNLPRQELIVK